jgi:hypothetical protein
MEFNFYIQKMQMMLKNENLKPLLQRRKSKELANLFSISIEEKKEKIEKIKSLLKENKKDQSKEEISSILDNLRNTETKQNQMIKFVLDDQHECFKTKLEKKKLERLNSQPSRMKKFNTFHTKDHSIKISKSPVKKNSRLSLKYMQFLNDKDTTQVEEKVNATSSDTEDFLNKMISHIEKLLGQNYKNREESIELFLEQIYSEKIEKIFEIYKKYEIELRSLEIEADVGIII